MTTRLVLQQDALREVLAVVTRASGKSSVSKYEMVRLDLLDSRLQLACFNGSFAAIGCLPVQVQANDQSLHDLGVYAETLKSLVNTIVGEITLNTTEGGIQIKNATNRSTLKTSAEIISIPPVPRVETPFILPGKLVKDLVKVTSFALDDWSRPALNGVWLRTSSLAGNPMIEAQSADGIRLGRVIKRLEASPSSPLDVLLPAAFVKMLGDVVQDSDTLCIFRERNTIFFQIEGERRRFTLLALEIDSRYPDTSEIIRPPSRVEAEFVLNLEEAALAAKQVNIVTRESSVQAMFLKVQAGQSEIRVVSNEAELGRTRRHLLAQNVAGNGWVWLQARVFAEILSAMSSCRRLTIQLQGSFSPVHIKDEAGEFLAILMPLDIKDDPFEPQITTSAIPVDIHLAAAVPAAQ